MVTNTTIVVVACLGFAMVGSRIYIKSGEDREIRQDQEDDLCKFLYLFYLQIRRCSFCISLKVLAFALLPPPLGSEWY